MLNNNAKASIPNAVTWTVICINAIEEADYSGVLYNPYLPEPVPFDQILGVINTLEQFFNSISYPQPYFEDRSFLSGKQEPVGKDQVVLTRHWTDKDLEKQKGKVATFEVEVRFRKSATWQGDVTWREKDVSCSFVSALELVKLIDNAITTGTMALSQ